MKNIVDYAKYEFRSFEELDFNEIDSLVLSKLSYFKFGRFVSPSFTYLNNVRIGELARAEYFGEYYTQEEEENTALMYAVCASPRFRDIELTAYREHTDAEAEKQFAAITFILPDKRVYIAFRGTDSTFVGWKEDFNMAYITPIPSQEEATAYLDYIGSLSKGELMVGGHSKGGNLAVYSAAFCAGAFQERISKVYSHDGPGFVSEITNSSQYIAITPRVAKTVPQASTIGLLLSNETNLRVVKCDGFWLMQHNPYMWETGEDGRFVTVEKINVGAKSFAESLNSWLSGITKEQRELFVDTLFDIIESTDTTNFTELAEIWTKKLSSITSTLSGIDDETKKFLSQTVTTIIGAYVKNLLPKPMVKEKSKQPLRLSASRDIIE